jgi:hypothetical protein
MRSFTLGTGCLFAVLTVIALLEVCGRSFADKATDKAAQRKKAFGWMDGLGYPAIKKLKFVKVATGQSYMNAGGQPENSYIHGVLLQEMGKKFDVLGLQLERMTFEKTPLNTPPHKRVAHEPADLGKFAAATLKKLEFEAQEAKDEDGIRKQMMQQMLAAMSGQYVSGRIMTFSLAWFCFHHGLGELSEKLYDQANNKSHDRGWEDKRTLQEKLATELATAEMWTAVVAFENPAVSRAILKGKFERIVKYFPKTDHHQRAVETVAILEQMIREDAARTAMRAKGKPFNLLDNKEQAKELVFLLREQTGFQWSQPGWCDIFRNPARDMSTPAHQLVNLGYDAVPELIKALGDKRFTRAVGYGRNFFFSHRVLTVGECAQTILERISGLSLREPIYSKDIQTKDMPEAEKVKAEAKAWYAELRTKGEKQWLIEIVRRGKHRELATRLREKYPNDALSALIAGAKAANSDWNRYSFVFEVGSIDGEESLRFLLTELKEGARFQGRYAAALCLSSRKRPEGLEAMIVEWRERKFAQEKSDWPSHHASDLAGFLAQSGKPEAVAALAKDMSKWSLDARLAIVEAMLCDPIRESFKRDNATDKELRKLRRAVEALLVTALDDTEQRFGMSGSRNGKSYSNPRGCDLAGYVLNELDPVKYPFDLEAPWSQRRREIFAMKNVWRQANKLPPLTIPERKQIVAVPETKLRPLLDAFLTGNPEQKRQAQADIEKLGPGTFAAVVNRRAAAVKKEEGERLDNLLNRIACIVTEIKFADRSLKPDAALSKKLEQLKGKPFESKVFLKVIGETLKAPPLGMRGVRVTAERIGGGTGFSLRFDLLDQARVGGKAKVEGPPTWLEQTEHIAVGNKGVHGLFGSSQLSVWTEDHNSELARVLDRVLASAPELSIDISLGLTLKWKD